MACTGSVLGSADRPDRTYRRRSLLDTGELMGGSGHRTRLRRNCIKAFCYWATFRTQLPRWLSLPTHTHTHTPHTTTTTPQCMQKNEDVFFFMILFQHSQVFIHLCCSCTSVPHYARAVAAHCSLLGRVDREGPADILTFARAGATLAAGRVEQRVDAFTFRRLRHEPARSGHGVAAVAIARCRSPSCRVQWSPFLL